MYPTIRKQYRDFPAGHRQHLHDGHCSKIHGHDWGFDLVLGCSEYDEFGFVLDFGKMKFVKEWLEHMFDHTLLLSKDDPLLPYLQSVMANCADIRVVDSVSCEGLSRMVFTEINTRIRSLTKDRAFLVSLTVHEDSKNSATFCP